MHLEANGRPEHVPEMGTVTHRRRGGWIYSAPAVLGREEAFFLQQDGSWHLVPLCLGPLLCSVNGNHPDSPRTTPSVLLYPDRLFQSRIFPPLVGLLSPLYLESSRQLV